VLVVVVGVDVVVVVADVVVVVAVTSDEVDVLGTPASPDEPNGSCASRDSRPGRRRTRRS
jgi:hypothetical protein